MKVFVNSKETELLEGTLIQDLVLQLQLPDRGVAIAVNNRMVPRLNWESHVLQENDHITIIKAACGG